MLNYAELLQSLHFHSVTLQAQAAGTATNRLHEEERRATEIDIEADRNQSYCHHKVAN